MACVIRISSLALTRRARFYQEDERLPARYDITIDYSPVLPGALGHDHEQIVVFGDGGFQGSVQHAGSRWRPAEY
jgi:hypothetical protein